MSPGTTSPLFQPMVVGDMNLAHRVVLAPMTRYRNDDAHAPTEMGIEYYKQRASVPGTLLITEATFISGQASGQPNAPGIWNDTQVAAWKKVVDTVHAQGSYIYLQLWALGRTARPALFHKEFPDYPFVAPSPIALKSHPDPVPRELTKDEIKEYVRWFGDAAASAVNRAGFDGVELHGATGYLPDQFLQDVSNKRTDEYGGTIENRARFILEAMDTIVAAVGENKVAIRLSPWSLYQDMRMNDPIPQFTYLVEKLKERFPNLSYLHVVGLGGPGNEGPKDPDQIDFLHNIWKPRPFIANGGFDRASGIKAAAEKGQLISYGQSFLANDIPLNKPDHAGFFAAKKAEGYITYPFSEQFLKTQKA